MSEKCRLTAARKAGYSYVPTRVSELSSTTAGMKPVEPILHAAPVVSTEEETEQRAVCYSVLKGTGSILALVPRHSECKLQTRCQES